MLPAPRDIGEPASALVDASRADAVGMLSAMMMQMDAVGFEAARALIPLLAAHSRDGRKAAIGGVGVEPHPDHYKADIVSRALNEYLEGIGNQHGIFDLAQDNGLRVLTIKLLLNLGICAGRGGNDLYDASGREYELKTLNLDNEKLGVTTSHHLKHLTINRYRGVGFIIAAYRRGRLVSIYILHPEALEDQFLRWEASLDKGASHLNNPLISISAVRMNGELVFGEPLPRRKIAVARRQLEMDVAVPEQGDELHPLNSLEEGLAASLARSRDNARIRVEKAEAKARKSALKAAELQSELPF